MKHILIVEDNEAINRLIETNLMMYGYTCEKAFDGQTALHLIKNNTYDLIILDVMLPQMTGFELLDKIHGHPTPVIMLTALDTVSDKVIGLKKGADDYITKPFEAVELLARIEAVLRRSNKVDVSVLSFQHVSVDLLGHTVSVHGQEVSLTAKEFDLLVYFIKNENLVLSRETLLEKIWGYDFLGGSRTVDLHVKRIRTKVKLYDALKTVHRVGYVLKRGD